MRQCGKIWYSQRDYRSQYNTAHAHCMLDKATETHSKYVILTAFPWQQLFRKRASILRLYVHCLHCRNHST